MKSILDASERVKANFWKKVRKTEFGCWEWIGVIDPDGYGQLTVQVGPKKEGNRVNLRSNRSAWELANNARMPEGQQACHHCDNRKCCRPDHLFLGTNNDNRQDMKSKGRAPTGKRNGSVTHPEKVLRGSKHGYSKLTEEQILQMRSEFNPAIRGQISRAAEKFKVSRSLARMILLREIWTHI